MEITPLLIQTSFDSPLFSPFSSSSGVLAAYLLAQLGGKTSPSADDITKILESVGIDAPEDKISKLLSELEGKNVEEVIAMGMGKLASVPVGGGAAAGGGGGGGGGGDGGDAAPAEAAKEEEPEEEEEEDMEFDLFD